MKIKILSLPKHSFADGGDTGNGVTIFKGIKHGQFGLDGIPQGIAADGLPNYVEGGGFDKNENPLEGEVKYKDYIYSARLKPSKSLLKEFNLPDKYAGKTFAEVADILQKESEDRPNDPISRTTLDTWMSRLAAAQENHKHDIENRKLAKEFNNLSDEEKAVLLAASGQGIDLSQPMYADGGKIYIKPENRGKFTALKERTGHSATWFKEHGTPAQKKMATFALNARKWKHDNGGHLFDGKDGNPSLLDLVLKDYEQTLSNAPYNLIQTEKGPSQKRIDTILNLGRVNYTPSEVLVTPDKMPNIGLSVPTTDPIPVHDTSVKKDIKAINKAINKLPDAKQSFDFNPENLRYAPVLGSVEAMLRAATQPKDYTLSNRIENIASQYQPKAAPHIGGYRKYMPYDVNLGDAENLAIEAAALRANKGQNRATQNALNAAVINASQKAAAQRNLAAQQANEANRLAVDTFNLGIDQFNAQRDAQYDQMNAEIENRRLSALMAAAQAADASNTAWANMYNTTRNNFFDQLGNVGQDNWNRNQMLKYLQALGYESIV